MICVKQVPIIAVFVFENTSRKEIACFEAASGARSAPMRDCFFEAGLGARKMTPACLQWFWVVLSMVCGGAAQCRLVYHGVGWLQVEKRGKLKFGVASDGLGWFGMV